MTELRLYDVVTATVESDDLNEKLDRLVTSCVADYRADAAAILVAPDHGPLDLLATSSHRIDSLELLQIQADRGPCVEVIETEARVVVEGSDALVDRWGDVGSAFVAAGFVGAHSFPMRWHDQVFGGLNIFLRELADRDHAVAQCYADLAALAVLQPTGLSLDDLVTQVTAGVSTRGVIEQAKGHLAYTRGIDVDAAHDLLQAEARAAGLTLSDQAHQVLGTRRPSEG